MLKKYILINDLSNGGAEKVVSKIVNYDPSLFVLIKIWPNDFNTVDCDVVTLLNKKGFLIWDLIIALVKLFWYVKNNNVERINSHLFWSNYLNLILSIITKHKPILTHCVSFESKFSGNKFLYFFHSFMCKALLRFSYKNTFKSFDMMNEYRCKFKLDNCEVIYNPIDSHMVNLLSEEHDSLNFNFREDKEYLLCVGRFHKTKNQIKLIDVLSKLERKYELIFLGDGDKKDEVEKYSSEIGVLKRVHFLGQVSNPYIYYKKSSMLLSASLSEGFPNVLIEAIALNCFPIYFDCPTGPKEILSLGYEEEPIKISNTCSLYGLGILTSSLDDDHFAQAVKIKSDKNLYIDELARDKVLSTTNLSVIHSKYISL